MVAVEPTRESPAPAGAPDEDLVLSVRWLL
jgi:hypothetical protein